MLGRKRCDIAGRVALVTGAGGTLGRSCAISFAREGCDLILWDLCQKDMEATRDAVMEAVPGCHCWLQRVDVSNRDTVYRAALEAREAVAPRHVAILVNNAGVAGGGRFLEIEDSRVLATFQVNALAQVWTCKAFLPAMLEAGWGHIVTVASMAGLLPCPGMVDYSASKAAAVAFTEGLRRELREWHGSSVRTSLVCPAHIKTPLFQGFKQAFLPSLEPDYVAGHILDCVRYSKEMVTLPQIADPAVVKGLLPVAAVDAVTRWLGFGRMTEKVDTEYAAGRVRMMTPSKL